MNNALKLIAELLPLLPGVILNVSSAVEAFTHGSGLLTRIVDEDRDPTPEEWAEWRSRIDTVHNEIQAS